MINDAPCRDHWRLTTLLTARHRARSAWGIYHLFGGRFVFGSSPGGLLSDAEAFGNLNADRNAMLLDAVLGADVPPCQNFPVRFGK